MSEAVTKLIQYIYLDVVDFTKDRSVEAQSDIVKDLNQAVKSAITHEGEVIFLPSGDGMGVALLDAVDYDQHLKSALAILKQISDTNSTINDPMRKFSVRVGVNQNVDNVVTDINGNKNVAGAGINEAQRVMSVAGASQLLVGHQVYETAKHREKYMKSFRSYAADVKHGARLSVHQFVESGHVGLATEEPPQFKRTPATERRLNLLEAYYLAYAISLRQDLIRFSQRSGMAAYVITLMLWFLAKDAETLRTAPDYDVPALDIFGDGKAPLVDVFDHYNSLDFSVCCELAMFVRSALRDIHPLFEESTLHLFVVNELGKQKLKREHPDIWSEMSLG